MIAYTWVIEFQKRGLPHGHMLVIMHRYWKPRTPADLDKVISAELPDPTDPTVPKTQVIKSYFWNTTVLAPGDTTYHFKFIVLDRNGNVQGYFWWDPYIHITS